MAEIMGIPLSNVTKNQKTTATPQNLAQKGSNPLPPVIGYRLKGSTVEVVRVKGSQRGGGKRGECTEISNASIKNAMEVLSNSEVELNSMAVLTYRRYPMDGDIVKSHLKSLLAAIRYRYGDYEYFWAIEYQRRGAPHIHLALSIDLGSLGEVITLTRKKNGRRSPTFQTVQEEQNWLFATWLNIITKENPAYNGVRLKWGGIDENDTYMHHRAYFEHNSGVGWEVMRDRDGAKRYLLKELSGLSKRKNYQRIIPEGFTNPGRHYGYSPGVKFPESKIVEFEGSESELRKLLKISGWKFLPKGNRPLFKWLWNAAPNLKKVLVYYGIDPIKGGFEALIMHLNNLEVTRYIEGVRYTSEVKAKVLKNIMGDFVLAHELSRDGDSEIAKLLQEFNEFVADWNSSVPVG